MYFFWFCACHRLSIDAHRPIESISPLKEYERRGPEVARPLETIFRARLVVDDEDAGQGIFLIIFLSFLFFFFSSSLRCVPSHRLIRLHSGVSLVSEKRERDAAY